MKKSKSQKSKSSKKSEAAKKGWVTRRLHQGKTRTSRKIPSEKLKKLQRIEKLRNSSRRKAQKKGHSIASDKPKLHLKKPTRPARRPSKKRVSVR